MTSINIYLIKEIRDEEGLVQSPSFKNDYKFNGINIKEVNGHLYAKSKSIKEPIHESLVEFVDEISCHETFSVSPSRERGVYRLKSAKAELQFNGHEKSLYRLEIVAKNLEDIQEISLKIKIGKIRPEESFEGAQDGMSRSDLEKNLKEAQDAFKVSSRTNAALMISEKTLKDQRERVVQELTEAESTWKFWRVRDMILNTLTRLAKEKMTEDENK